MRSTEGATERRLAWLLGLGLLLWLGWGRGQHSNTGSATHNASSAVGMQFAIADLDGDRKPDMASVEVEKQQSGSTSYAIRLRFAAGTDSYIGVRGPLGGLRVAVRDVNGDDTLDLVLTSVVNPRVIQVLLNDGHGNFSVAQPGEYPELKEQGTQFLRSPSGPVSDNATLAQTRSNFAREGAVASGLRNLPATNPLVGTYNEFAFQRELHPRLGRSPPAVVLPA